MYFYVKILYKLLIINSFQRAPIGYWRIKMSLYANHRLAARSKLSLCKN